MNALIKFSFTILLFLSISRANAQLIPISLEQKQEQSEVIIEGQVIEQHAYEASDGEIYTENIIEIFSFIKGNLNTPYLSVITMGGRTDRAEVSWTHMAKLKQNQKGVFFLIPTKRPTNTHPENSFELYSSSQGFYEIFKDDDGIRILSSIDKFNDPKQFYEKLGVNYSAINGGFVAFSASDNSCVIFKIVVSPASTIAQTSSVVNADIYMKLEEGLEYLYKSNFIVKYSGDFFGQNIVATGNLSFSGGELVTSSYDLQMLDFADDKLEVKLDGLTTNTSELEQVNTNFKHLASAQINLIGWSNETPIEWNPNDGNTSNLYIEANTELIKEFDCAEVILEETGVTAGPEITSISPLTAVAGVDGLSFNAVPIIGTVTVTGTEFGTPAPGESTPDGYYLKFETLGGSWIAPLEGDYISWTETEIQVKVPSIGYDNNSSDLITDFNTEIACTGKIRICRDGIFNCGMYSTSDDDLYIPFSARNKTQENSDGELESVRAVLLDFVGGGYSIRYNPNFSGYAGALGAFDRALTTWRCATKVNFDSDHINPIITANGICAIEFYDLPVGVPSTTRGATLYSMDDTNCGDEPNIDYYFLRNFRMRFNENINWHTGEDMPGDLNWNDSSAGTLEADLESTALHEIGHAHLLNHTCNTANVMFAPGPPEFRRGLTNDDDNGGNHISLLSNQIADSDCLEPGMELIDLAECDITAIIEINGELLSIEFSPNPTFEEVNISFETSQNIDGTIVFFNSIGKLALSIPVHSNAIKIDVRELSIGIYHLVYTDRSGKQSFIGNISKI